MSEEPVLSASEDEEWFFASAEATRKGPVVTGELARLAASGEVGQDSLVWREGMDDWQTYAEAAAFNPGLVLGRCLHSGATYPLSEMLEYGDGHVALENKEAFVSSLQGGGAVVASGFPDFVDPTRRTSLLQRLLAAGAALSVLWILSDIWILSTMAQVNPYEMTPPEVMQSVLVLLELLVFVVTVVVFAGWIMQANRNARAMGARHMTFTPGWSVGWFFIPIANLWKPYQAMSQIFRASADPQRWPGTPVPAILKPWWALWIIYSLFSNYATRMAVGAETPDELANASLLSIVEECLYIALCVVAMRMVAQLCALQIHRFRIGSPQ